MGGGEYERSKEKRGVDGLAERGGEKRRKMMGREEIKEKKSRKRRSGLSLNP